MAENYFSQFGISTQITNLQFLKNKIKSRNAFNNKSKVCAQMNENSFFSFWQSCRQTESQDKKNPPIIINLETKIKLQSFNKENFT
jgi:hypothetical protein